MLLQRVMMPRDPHLYRQYGEDFQKDLSLTSLGDPDLLPRLLETVSESEEVPEVSDAGLRIHLSMLYVRFSNSLWFRYMVY
jgi:hypothetical protein